MGVDIFFVLSGFLIASLLTREYERRGRIHFWGFYRRRLLRISPAFYCFLIVMGLLAAAGLLDVSWQQLLISGTYTWNYAHLLGVDSSFLTQSDAGSWYLGHTWTISYGLYLWQQFFNHSDSPAFLGFPLNVAEAIVAATLSYILVERPFLILKDRGILANPPPIPAGSDVGRVVPPWPFCRATIACA